MRIIVIALCALLSDPVVARQQIIPEQSRSTLVELLGQLTQRDRKQSEAAYRELARRRDARAVPGLIELMRFPRFNDTLQLDWLLTRLTGKDFGNNWIAWSQWLTAQPKVELPPEFLEWKAALFSAAIDSAFEKFLYPGMPLRIRIEEIVWGGVKKDGIPALTNPKLIRAEEATYLSDKDLVFGVEINGDARAYPLRIMDWHEMLNDVIGGQPVSLAYCTLCRSGILFDTHVGDRTFTFGSSGLLYRSNKLMYDRETESLWMTIPGEPVSGKLAGSGIKLKKLPLVVTAWSDWRRLHPATRVLSLDTGHKRDYSPGAAYGPYFASPDLMFPVPSPDPRMKPKEEIFALDIEGQSKAYVLKKLRQTPILHDALGGENIVLVTNEKTGAVRAYSAGKQRFTRRDSLLVAEDGQEWQVTESSLVNRKTNEQLPRLPGHLAYWFGWASFHPRTLLLK
ncbi:MAG: DUF3179 domain-containing protein [Blastocatellia bacterium]